MAPRISPKGVQAPRLQAASPGGYPIDPYTRPPAENDLGRLAAALGDLAPTLGKLAEGAKAAEVQSGEEAGRADFLEMKKTGLAIKEGKMKASGSPWFRRAYHETVGSLAAGYYGSDLDAAMRDPTSPIAESTEPADFDKWSGSKRQEWLGSHVGKPNADFMAGFNATVVGAEQNLRTRFVAEAGARLEKNSIKVFYAQLQTMTADLRKNPTNAAGQTREQQIAFWFTTLARQKYFLNPKSGTQINATMTEALFDAARAYEDPALLKVAQHIESGIPGAKLALTHEFLSKVDDVDKEIRNNRQNRLASEDKDEKRLHDDGVEAIYTDLGKAFEGAENPSIVDVKPFTDRMAVADPDSSPKLDRVIAAYRRTGAVVEDQDQLRGLFSRAFDNDLPLSEVLTLMGGDDPKISIQTADKLRAQIRLNKTGRGAKALIQDPYYTAGVKNLVTLFVSQSGLTDTHRQSAAEQQFRRDWIEYRLGDGAKAGVTELNDWVQNHIESTFRTFAQGGYFSGQGRIIDKHKESPQPTMGPQPTKWEKDVVIDRLDLDQLAREHSDILGGRRKAFSPVALEVLLRYPDLKSGETLDPAKVTKFIESQRLAQAFNPTVDDSRPDQLR